MKTVAATREVEAVETVEPESEPQRMCKFRIPYVGRVIEVPAATRPA